MTAPLLPPAKLRCAYQVNPLGVAPDRLRLSWQAGLKQHAYQLRVASGERELASGDRLCWDSGRVESRECADIPYCGSPVEPGARYAWAVRVWDDSDDGESSPWSEPAWFEVELNQADGWQAAWIGLGRVRTEVKPPSADGPCDGVGKALAPVPYLRREFDVATPVSSARLYVTALGLYEARLNGRRVGDGVLTPGWTDYHQRIQYQTYDVTDLIRDGANVLGAMIADGWYSGFIGFDAKRAGAMYGAAPEFLAQLVITLADGSRQVVATDGRWRSSFGAIRHGDLLMGERHDLADAARLGRARLRLQRLGSRPLPAPRRSETRRRSRTAGQGSAGVASQERHGRC